jgi:hypothetical protein
VLYGHKPRHFGLQPDVTCSIDQLYSWMQERELMMSLVKQHLLRAQVRMKHQVDKKQSDVTLAVGDEVFLKL